MPLVVNGVTIPQNVANALMVNGVSIKQVIANGVAVWNQALYSGQASPIVVATSRMLTAGVDFPADTLITVCLCGGGGGGSCTNQAWNHAGGGHASAEAINTFTFASGTSINASIGAGGNGTAASYTNGGAGGTTSFGTHLASGGGSGGVQRSSSYAGNSGTRNTSCGGVRSDGSLYFNNAYAYGGQAGVYGNGGKGGTWNASYPTAGGIGAGGGGIVHTSGQRASGAGGRGQIVISW